jgi:tRNA A37 N6-isopentenylltransferase MiaA
MYINKRFFANFLAKYSELEATSDRLEDKMEKAKADGNIEKYQKLDRKDDRIASKMDGMTDVLMMLGYEIRYQSGQPVIVERG